MKKIVSIILIIILAGILCSCGDMQKQIKEESVEKIVSKIIGEEVDVHIISPTPDAQSTAQPTSSGGILDNIIKNGDDEEIVWPETIPSDVPKLNLTIKSSVKTPNGVILDFGEIDAQSAKDYAEVLKDKLYETVREEINEKKFDAQYKKENISVTVYWYQEGSLSLMITW